MSGRSHRALHPSATKGVVEPLDSGLRVFTYAVAEKANLYVAIVDVLTAAKERFTLQLRPAEVARELDGDRSGGEVADALAALEGWATSPSSTMRPPPTPLTSSTPSGSSTS